MWFTRAMTSAPEIGDEATQSTVSYGLDELAALSGVPSRTIRYYQSERLIPSPAKKGRDAVYGPDHVERLRLIAELRDRGLNLGAIRDLVAVDHPARTVATWLGVDATLTAPWSDDRPRIVSKDELDKLVGDRRRGLLGDLQQARYVEPGPSGTWLVSSPGLLDLALQLFDAGIDIDLSGRMRDLLRSRLSKAVDESVKLLVEHLGAGFAGAASPDELATALGTLRPAARETTSLILAQEVERALRDLVERRPTGTHGSTRRRR